MTATTLLLTLLAFTPTNCPIDIGGSRAMYDYSTRPPAATVAIDLQNTDPQSTIHVTELDVGVLDVTSPKYHKETIDQSPDVPVLTRVFHVDAYVRPASHLLVPVPLTDDPNLLSGNFAAKCTSQYPA
jgi:hypothetical protein